MLFKVITDLIVIIGLLLIAFYSIFMALVTLSDLMADSRKASHKSNLMEE